MNASVAVPSIDAPTYRAAVSLVPLRQVRSVYSRVREVVMEWLLFACAASSVLITAGIIGILLYESSTFFSHVSLREFFIDTQWTPLFSNAHYGIMPLVCGTLITTFVALAVAMPMGTIIAIYLSEYAPRLI